MRRAVTAILFLQMTDGVFYAQKVFLLRLRALKLGSITHLCCDPYHSCSQAVLSMKRNLASTISYSILQSDWKSAIWDAEGPKWDDDKYECCFR